MVGFTGGSPDCFSLLRRRRRSRRGLIVRMVTGREVEELGSDVREGGVWTVSRVVLLVVLG